MSHWIRPKHSPAKENYIRPFQVEWTVGKVQTLAFDDAADYTANLIYKNYPELYLCFSGGMDSVFVAEVLLRNNIPFVPVIVDYLESDPDIWYAYYWCEQHKITPMVYKVTLENNHEFIRKLLKYAVINQTDVNFGYITNFAADIIPNSGSLITGCGEPLHVPLWHNDLSTEFIELHECCYYLQMSHKMNRHPGGFFNYVPEILYNMVREADLSKNTQEIKSILYKAPFRPKFNVYQSCHWGDWEVIKNKLIKNPDFKMHKIKKVDFLNSMS